MSLEQRKAPEGLVYRSIVSFTPDCAIEKRAEDGAKTRSLRGLCCATDKKYLLYQWGDGFKETETAQSGLFTKTLSEKKNIFILHSHAWDRVVATTESGRARVWEESDASVATPGLYFEVPDIGESVEANDLWIGVRDGNYKQGSFGFRIIKQVVEESKEERHVILLEVDVHETTICARGANPHTDSEARSFFNIPDGVEPGGNHSEAGAAALDEARDASTSEPEPNHSEAESEEAARALALRRRRLALRLKLSEVK